MDKEKGKTNLSRRIGAQEELLILFILDESSQVCPCVHDDWQVFPESSLTLP